MSDIKKILIVDDSQTSRQVIRNYVLRHRRSWIQYESDNGMDAIEMVKMIEPDFITMDVNMPNMSGIEAAERINKLFPQIRITLLTANVQEAVQIRAEELGFGFIEKPIKESSILAAIEYFEKVDINEKRTK